MFQERQISSLSIQDRVIKYLNDRKKEKILKNSGVLDLFRGFQKTGFLKKEEKTISSYTPAEIRRREKGEVSIIFNNTSPIGNSEITIKVKDDLSLNLVSRRSTLSFIRKEEIKIVNGENLGEIIAREIVCCIDEAKTTRIEIYKMMQLPKPYDCDGEIIELAEDNLMF